ncbi:MAG: hypothetical protein Faunusvirus20_2 [Faunusvirus sp.]|jgi:hypothetical protein|uniref:Uncharacterized protein n=1 Tax=Faunusvirus sp. TaxID=2487766 RepID=A0A3G5A202_9VIRU|nr:MAG: hypothetical protein Faunusvirus20_2 [Faunusvirus sp.]
MGAQKSIIFNQTILHATKFKDIFNFDRQKIMRERQEDIRVHNQAVLHATEFKNIFYSTDCINTSKTFAMVEAECMQYIDKHRDFYNIKVMYSGGNNIWGAGAAIYACYFRYNKVVSQLITNGVDINSADTYGDTLLITACQNSNYDMALKLIDGGADVNMANERGQTALSLLCYNCSTMPQFSTAVELIKHGADVNATDTTYNSVNSPLGYALRRANTELAVKLIDSGARFIDFLNDINTGEYPQVANKIRHKYGESILAVMNDECPTNIFAASFRKIYVPQLVNTIAEFIL